MSDETPDGTGTPESRDEPIKLPMTDLTIQRARLKLSGWHFAKEALTPREREILYVAEGLLRLLDERAEGGHLQ